MADVSIEKMLKDFGIATRDAQMAARDALVSAKIISRPNRTNIASEKRQRALQALQDAFVWHCRNGDCRTKATGNPAILVEQANCMICGGSTDRSSLMVMVSRLAEADVRRILVVGGTEAKRREIREKSPPGVEWRFVDGSKARDNRYFRADRQWAEIIVIWGGTILDHKVSSHFDAKGDPRVITASRRSIGGLSEAVIEHVNRR